jgi:hypothetical protein
MFLLTFLAILPSSPTALASPALQGIRKALAELAGLSNGFKSRGAYDSPGIPPDA